MPRTPLIIDCDPGVDDAIGLFLAFAAADAIDLLAITTLSGNVSAETTARNACILRQIAGREDVPVHIGALRPLAREPEAASTFHGETGLGDLPLFEPRQSLAPGQAADAIVDIIMQRPPKTVAIAVMGPSTNLALAIRAQPEIAGRLGQVVIMGGARSEGGNITASAEFNIYADPEAADIVFASGCCPIVLGLDATHQVRVTPARLAAIERIGGAVAAAGHKLLAFANRIERDVVGGEASPLHDPCTIAYLLAPQLFRTVPARISIETQSSLTRGHTSVEFRVADRAPNARWVYEVDAEGVFALLNERLAQ
jgi:purine nucleosidase